MIRENQETKNDCSHQTKKRWQFWK
ncbi:hypothetical protein P5808_21700 [Bacillus cereus]|nr:hypothetical protein [Bacillus cereus]MDF9506826.1 hypothetical protein [Bacillus cereus]MDF9596619.1 hypothetical protein [Bacillus cereus]MDF9610207.1 hypothetical protein [Bacillus cereus]MDF9661109.1 hypothetical protein [Bacillus cereus]